MIIAKAMDSDRGRNMALGTPVITKAGANTARIQSKIRSSGKEISLQASSMACLFWLAHLQMLVNIFNGYRGLVHQDTDGQCQSAQRHDIDWFVPPVSERTQHPSRQPEW